VIFADASFSARFMYILANRQADVGIISGGRGTLNALDDWNVCWQCACEV
jgi:hypothetical protein